MPAAAPLHDEVLPIARQKGVTGLLAFQSFLRLQSPPPKSIDRKILLSLLAFTSSRDPWTTPLSQSTATALLSIYEPQTCTKEFIINHVLQEFIRPLFSKSKPEAVTASGRKAMPSSAPLRRFDAKYANERTKPWIIDTPYAITIFEWAVENSSKEIASSYFNLYIPPLLTLLDSTSTPIRSRALDILSNFIPLLTTILLTQTGLGEVFEDAITPTLMFLPNLTPVDESVQLLEPAYQALIILGSVLYETEVEFAKGKDEERKKMIEGNEMRFWDRLLRKGVLMGFAHASEHPAIVEVLLRNLGVVIEKLGVFAVKHLKEIIPILTTTLTDAFGPSHPSLLLNAIKTLQNTLLNCWPRMSETRYRVEIISALALCWTNVCQAPTESLREVKRELSVVGKILFKTVGGDTGVDIERELEPVFAVDKRLRKAFGLDDDLL